MISALSLLLLLLSDSQHSRHRLCGWEMSLRCFASVSKKISPRKSRHFLNVVLAFSNGLKVVCNSHTHTHKNMKIYCISCAHIFFFLFSFTGWCFLGGASEKQFFHVLISFFVASSPTNQPTDDEISLLYNFFMHK